MMSIAETSSPGIGHNEAPDFGVQVTERLERDYAELGHNLSAALDEARVLPARVDDDDTQGQVAVVVKKLRDLSARIEGVRAIEKEPFLRGGVAVDSFFGRMKEKLFRKNKNDKPGAADVLQARVDDYVGRKAAAERARREEQERKARIEEKRIREEREEQERIQREESARADRARKVENEDAARGRAAEAEESAERLRREEEDARNKRLVASADSTAKTADLVRTRTEQGNLVTAKQEGFAEIEDSMKLDAVALWPFVKEDAKLSALKLWARTTQHRTQMSGAIIGMRDKAVIR